MTDAKQRDDAVPLATFVAAASQRALRNRLPLLVLLLLLTLTAGWMDALCYLALDRTFASIMSGNIIFVGLSIAQGNRALLVHAIVAVLVFLVGVTLGSSYLQTLPPRQPVESWRRTLAWYLLAESSSLSPCSGRSRAISPGVRRWNVPCWASLPSAWGYKARCSGHSISSTSTRSQ